MLRLERVTIADNRRIVLVGGDHFVSLVAPDPFNQALEDFWSTSEAGTPTRLTGYAASAV